MGSGIIYLVAGTTGVKKGEIATSMIEHPLPKARQILPCLSFDGKRGDIRYDEELNRAIPTLQIPIDTPTLSNRSDATCYMLADMDTFEGDDDGHASILYCPRII